MYAYLKLDPITISSKDWHRKGRYLQTLRENAGNSDLILPQGFHLLGYFILTVLGD